jgi:hypothetical protein
MPLTASTCVTFTGYEPLGDTLYLYSNYDNFLSSFGSVLTDDITGNNCPYIISGIPDGTTSIQFRDPQSLCCTTIFLQNNNLCLNCNLSITNYLQETVSQLVAGFLVGDCDDNISDYIIKWYRTGSTEVVFTTGYGTEFADIGWDLTHPLTGDYSPIAEPGVYYPVIDRVIINGVTYANSGETGTFPANLSCFNNQTVSVSAIECGQGNNIGDYSHHYLFDNYSVGVPPSSLSAFFTISSNTNYLAWKFQGFDVWDTISLTFYGSHYNNEPILIENLQIGQNALPYSPTGTSVNAQPKKIPSSSQFKKVTCLTGLTINNNDYIKINVAPNQTNANTKWDFYFECLETFDCSTCLDNFKDTPYKIVLSSITAYEVGCNVINVSYQLSGCTLSDVENTDIFKYIIGGANSELSLCPRNRTYDMYFENFICQTQQTGLINSICSSPSNTITYNKQIINNQGLFTISCSTISDLQYFYNSYLSNLSYSGNPTDNTSINYYRYYTLKVPIGNSPNETCGDSTPYRAYNFHTSSVVTTGGTGPYFMTLTMPTIINNLNFECSLGCDERINNTVYAINDSSLNPYYNLNFTTTTGSKYVNPFWSNFNTIFNDSVTARTDSGNYSSIPVYSNLTYPYSGNNNTFIPSLSAQTCDYTNLGKLSNTVPITNTQFTHSFVRVTLLDQNNLNYFKIESSPITNFRYSGSPGSAEYELALIYSSGTITYSNPNYCI